MAVTVRSETTVRPADVMVTVAGEADPLLPQPATTIRAVTPIVAAADLAARLPPRMSGMFPQNAIAASTYHHRKRGRGPR